MPWAASWWRACCIWCWRCCSSWWAHRRSCGSSPIVTGPIIILIGLNLAGTAVSNASTCWWLALVAIGIIIVANIWGKGMVKIIPILLGVVGSYLVALVATLCGAQLPDANGVMQPSSTSPL